MRPPLFLLKYSLEDPLFETFKNMGPILLILAMLTNLPNSPNFRIWGPFGWARLDSQGGNPARVSRPPLLTTISDPLYLID
jgi:hypothetical protein